MTAASTSVTVSDALVSLRADYAALLEGVARGERVFWIGAGVSRDQVPPVAELLRKVLTFLRDNAATNAGDDPHRQALESILAEHLPDELDGYRGNPTGWVVPDDLSGLTNSYSKILATDVGAEDADYLLWEAVDVRETYGAPEIEPGPEHWLIAFLVHEGLLTDAVTTNWDGLIERAVRDSTSADTPEKVSVLMSEQSFREGRAPFRLYKAHGCAVLARQDAAFRKYLVAQTFDITTWLDNPIFASVVDKLRELARTRESLMLGTSVQDSNLLQRIASATQGLRWPWHKDDPACLFAEPEITSTQKEVLKVVYRDDYAAHRAEICAISATGTYSGPLLAAATLHVIMEKFALGLAYVPTFAASGAVLADLESGIAQLTETIADVAGNDLATLVSVIRRGLSSLVQRYFEPANQLTAGEYKPVHERPVRGGADEAFRHLGVPQLSAVLALLGLGSVRKHWSLELETGTAASPGIIKVLPAFAGSRGPTWVAITRDWAETSALKATDLWVDGPDDLLVIQAVGQRPEALTRGPLGGLGSGRRVSARGRRVAWMTSVEPFARDTDALMDAFRAELSA